MEKYQKLKPLPFCLKTQLINYSISDDLVRVVVKLTDKIDLCELHDVLRATFKVRSTHMHTFGNNNEFVFFIGS